MNQVNGVAVYLIWYVNWSNNTEPAIVTDFVNNIGGTAYFNITSSYYDFNKFGGGMKDPVVNRVSFGGSITDNYSLGTNLTDNNVAQIVGSYLTSGSGSGDGHMFPVDPNGTTASYIAHELAETVTDPELNAWWRTSDGFEMGDLCEDTFGNTKLLPNGSSYNLQFGTRLYLVQRLWVNARGGYCALALDE